MPEDIKIPKAPKGWKPNGDQQAQIQIDPRLRQMTPDELYFYFNQPRRNATPVQPQPAPRQSPQQSGGILGGLFDYIRRSMGGG